LSSSDEHIVQETRGDGSRFAGPSWGRRGVGPAGGALKRWPTCAPHDGPFRRGQASPAAPSAMAGPASSATGAEERITRLIYEERSNEAGALE
jgi:hypothetical protein